MVVRRYVKKRCVFAAFVSATPAGGAARRGRIQRSLSDRGAWRELTRRRHVRGAVSRKASLKTTVPGVCRRRQRVSGGGGGVFYWTPCLLLRFRPQAKAKQKECRWRQSIGVPGAGDIYARAVRSCYYHRKITTRQQALSRRPARISVTRRCDCPCRTPTAVQHGGRRVPGPSPAGAESRPCRARARTAHRRPTSAAWLSVRSAGGAHRAQ